MQLGRNISLLIIRQHSQNTFIAIKHKTRYIKINQRQKLREIYIKGKYHEKWEIRTLSCNEITKTKKKMADWRRI